MKKVNVIYWSGTGNTEAMAKAIAQGAQDAGAEVKLLSCDEASASDATDCDALALGCPSMGMEVLEESVFEPFMESIEDDLAGKPLLLFGSYGWGDGEWMRNWVDRMQDKADLQGEGIICQESPSDDILAQLTEAGKSLA